MINLTYSEKKLKQIEAKKSESFSEGDFLFILEKDLVSYTNRPNNQVLVELVKFLDGGFATVRKNRTDYKVEINKLFKNTFNVGENPFEYFTKKVRFFNFDINSILFTATSNDGELYKIEDTVIKRFNWNPYVYNSKGEKEYYQRELVWTENDKRKLIQSIYMGNSCGSIIFREHSYESLEEKYNNGERELYFYDVVDGKQRLSTLIQFISDGFKDFYGNYFSDLSDHAQKKFGSSMVFSYGEMNCTDKETIEQFLKVNFDGVPQSTKHLNKVENILKNM